MKIAVMCLCIFSVLPAMPVQAHDMWISRGKFRDPVSGAWCCNADDCHPLEPDQVWHEDHGVTITIPYFGETHSFVVPNGRIQPSGDGQYWACLSTESASRGRGVHLGVRCFFEPLTQ